MDLKIEIIEIETCMGKVTINSEEKLKFLTDKEIEVLNEIGYTGKSKNGKFKNFESYLNSLHKGKFEVRQTKFDDGEFSESYEILRIEW